MKIKTLLLLYFSIASSFAQNTPAVIGEGDLSSIIVSEHHDYVLGFIGKEQKRLYMHFSQIVKSKDNPLVYFVEGRSRVANNIVGFKGELKIDSVKNDPEAAFLLEELPPELQDKKNDFYIVYGSYLLLEDSTANHVGTFKGKWKTYVWVHPVDGLMYNDLVMGDGYSNNEFLGTWTAYGKSSPRPAHWGEFRIPESGSLDYGVGEFVPNPENLDPNWKIFHRAYQSEPPMDPYEKGWWD